MKPKIGITLDCQESGTFSKRPHYALRKIYFDIIYAAGGLPVAIPHISEAMEDYLGEVDGVVIPGGNFASPSSWYLSAQENSPYENSPRLDFDICVIKRVLELDMPILGICAGMQLMAGIHGCKMVSNINDFIETDIDHLNERPAEELAHLVNLEADSKLKEIVGCNSFKVNTAHQEAVVEITDDILVSAVSPDGVIEAIEFPDKKFALAVQWHPEFFTKKGDPNFKIFEALVLASLRS